MIHELTKEQLEIVEYSDLYGYRETCKKFSLKHHQVDYLRTKRKRIKGQNKIDNNNFIEIPVNNVIDKVEKPKDEEISFSINNAKIKMNLSDFKKVFLND